MLLSDTVVLSLLSLCANLALSNGENFDQKVDWPKAVSVYQFRAKDISGKDVSLEKYRGHVLIVVNVASECGLTRRNYEQLVKLYEKYGDSEGLRILAFPSNQFNNQEPGTSEEILNFVKRYNVRFDVFEKIDVNGDDAHPLWKWLKKQKSGDIEWNFAKFVISKNGENISRFSSYAEPLELESTLESYFKS